MTTEETSLVAKAKDGDREAFRLLVSRYQNLVYGLAYSELGRFEDSQDVAQETFINAWRKLRQLRDDSQFGSWIRQMARNECRMSVRRRQQTAVLDKELAAPSLGLENRIVVEQALSRLSPTNREAFLLFTFHSFSLQEVGDFLGISGSTVMSRLRNARAQLRKDMEHTINATVTANRLPEDFASRIPVPYDEYDRTGFDQNSREPLNEFRKTWLLSNFPAGTTIDSVEEIGSEHTRICLRFPDGKDLVANLHTTNRRLGVETEAALLPIFDDAGIGVPEVLALPVTDPSEPEFGAIVALTDPPGVQSLFEWCGADDVKRINLSVQILLEWTDRIRALTGIVEQSSVASLIETNSLVDELDRTIKIGGPWMEDDRFREALEKVKPYVAAIRDTPVLSLAGLGGFAIRMDAEGQAIGLSDLKWARLEDPHYEITKAWVYDMWPFVHAGIVERYMVRHGLTMREFAPRLAVRALVIIQRELPLKGGDPWYRDWLFGWLEIALDNLEEVRPFVYPSLRT